MNGYVLFCLLICLRKLMNFDACQLNRNKIRVFIIIIIIITDIYTLYSWFIDKTFIGLNLFVEIYLVATVSVSHKAFYGYWSFLSVWVFRSASSLKFSYT